jgi:hypothetical protein
MEQSAVKWLFDNLLECPKDKFIWHSYLNKALEMEKQSNSEKPNCLISDEEIEKEANYLYVIEDEIEAFIKGAEWYREQLKKL